MVKVSDKSIGDEDKFETNYEQSNFDKIISTLLCRYFNDIYDYFFHEENKNNVKLK